MLSYRWLTNSKSVWLLPVSLIVLLTLSHFCFLHYSFYLTKLFSLPPVINVIEEGVFTLLMVASAYWLSVRLINKFTDYLKTTLFFQRHLTFSLVIPLFIAVLKALTFLVLFNLATQHLELAGSFSYVLNKLTSVFIICAISWILFKLIDISEQLLLHHYNAEVSGSLVERKVYTQTLILKRVAYGIISVLAAGAILVLFDNVRALGASVLTTAGVFGLILTFTAQRSLGSIFAGLEIALTQPIKIGDSVIVDDESGTIEEINFRSVVVKLWDWRRLVVPTNFFLEHSFQNWSRVKTTNLIGTVLLHVDFTLPVPDIRNKLESILKKSPLWDKNVGSLEVFDLQERVMQLRVLASARNPSDLSNLRAHIREQLITYIVKMHPYALPKTRFYTAKSDLELERNSRSDSRFLEA